MTIIASPSRSREVVGEEAGEGIDRLRSGRGAAKPVAEADQFEKRAVELDDMILGAPGMAVARADLEAEPAVERRLRGRGHGRR